MRRAARQIVKSIGCLGCHVVGEGNARRGRAAAHVRPAAREHRQQDDLRVDLQLGARSEALQPGHLHARPAADRRAGGRRRDLSVDAEGAGGDAAEGDARSGGGRRGAARLPHGGDAVRGGARRTLAKLDAAAKQIELGQRAISRYGCFSCHDIKGFENAQPIGTDLSEEGSKLVTRLDFAFITDIPHTSKTRLVPDQAARPAHLRPGPRAAAAREAADAELRLHARTKSSGCSRRS